MPPETDTTTVDAPAYTFPFTVPADLAAASEDDLRALHSQLRDLGPSLASVSPPTADSVAGLRASRDLAVAVVSELESRADLAADAAAFAAELAASAVPDGDDADAGDADDDDADADADDDGAGADDADSAASVEPPADPPAAVTASTGRRTAPAAPRVRDVARRRSSRPAPASGDGAAARYASMRASADVPGFTSGQPLTGISDVGRALAARLDRYPAQGSRAGSKWNANKRPVTVYDPADPGRSFQLKDFTRHSVVEFRREFPDELRVREGQDGYAVAEHAANERRLPGGNLRASAELAIKQGKSLTAAVGWCAPSDVIYDLIELESLDGMLDVPELQTTRGGWQIPVNGGPDFAAIFSAIGNAGNTHLSEDDVINGESKHCTEIPCPDFDDVRLGVDYVCITGGLLQRRGYPEAVARFARGAMVGLGHKVNAGLINDIVAGSGSLVTIPQDNSGDDAASAVLSAVDLAIVDMKYRLRMAFTGTMEVVLPWWALVPIRAGLARRHGIGMLDVTDAMILAWFTERKAVPRLVYDFQDAGVGTTAGPGGSTALTHLPPTVQFLVYPAGTWVKAVQDVVDLSTIYDSTLLETNQYTAIFTEDGWAALKMGPLSRRYLVNVDPSGVVGCCETVGS